MLLTFASSEAQTSEECKELVPDWDEVPWSTLQASNLFVEGLGFRV